MEIRRRGGAPPGSQEKGVTLNYSKRKQAGGFLKLIAMVSWMGEATTFKRLLCQNLSGMFCLQTPFFTVFLQRRCGQMESRPGSVSNSVSQTPAFFSELKLETPLFLKAASLL